MAEDKATNLSKVTHSEDDAQNPYSVNQAPLGFDQDKQSVGRRSKCKKMRCLSCRECVCCIIGTFLTLVLCITGLVFFLIISSKSVTTEALGQPSNVQFINSSIGSDWIYFIPLRVRHELVFVKCIRFRLRGFEHFTIQQILVFNRCVFVHSSIMSNNPSSSDEHKSDSDSESQPISKKRGTYLRFTPQQKLEIARHAARNGVYAAINRYSTRNMKIPRTTLLGWKKKYEAARSRLGMLLIYIYTHVHFIYLLNLAKR